MIRYTPPTLKAFALAACINNNIKIPSLEEFHGLDKKLCARDGCEAARTLYSAARFPVVPLVYMNGRLNRVFWWCPEFSSTGKVTKTYYGIS
jgi:hypothetical protein